MPFSAFPPGAFGGEHLGTTPKTDPGALLPPFPYNDPSLSNISPYSGGPRFQRGAPFSLFTMPVDSRKLKPGMEAASLTDVGLHRADNEDSYLYWEPESDEEFRRKGRLAIIADGMGGYEGGQEASRLAVETVRDLYDQNFSGDPTNTLVAAFRSAHEAIQQFGFKHPQFRGMGTTCTAAAIIDRKLFFAHVGDTRLYLVRGDSISRLTRDHSYVGRLVESGVVRSEDAESHPQRHILTAALGSGPEIIPDVAEGGVALQQDDLLILCTDGLWSLVSDQELRQVVRENPPSKACLKLVRMAIERDAPDNITVQMLRVAAE